MNKNDKLIEKVNKKFHIPIDDFVIPVGYIGIRNAIDIKCNNKPAGRIEYSDEENLDTFESKWIHYDAIYRIYQKEIDELVHEKYPNSKIVPGPKRKLYVKNLVDDVIIAEVEWSFDDGDLSVR